MGIDDRDHMRERYRDRQGKATGTTFWNDHNARVKQPHDKHGKAVPLGSASWIGGGGNGSGSGWFDTANRGFHCRKNRYLPKQRVRAHPARTWIFLLCAMPVLIPACREAKRSSWFPDRAAELPFPVSRTVTVNDSVDQKTATSQNCSTNIVTDMRQTTS